MVKEFEDVFLKDLIGLPSDKGLKFSIDLLPGTNPVSMAPYKMALVELIELKK